MAKKKSPGFQEMVERIGLKKAAKRFGVSQNTVQGWTKKGIPETRFKEAENAVGRHQRALKASKIAQSYKKMGWKRLKTYDDVDEIANLEPGHAKERWEQRKQWWEENRPAEPLPRRVAFVRDREGKLLYVNGDQVVWRGYTVTGRNGEEKLFWTLATYLDGYDSAEEFQEAYESLSGTVVRIHF